MLDVQVAQQEKTYFLDQGILEKNKITLREAQNVYRNTDAILNPLFPLDFTIHFQMDYNLPVLKPLHDYLYNLKKKMEAAHQIDQPGIKGFENLNDEIIQLNLNAYNKILDTTITFDKLLSPNFDIKIIKGSIDHITSLNRTIPHLSFIINSYDHFNPDVQLVVDFPNQILDFFLIYSNLPFQNDYTDETNYNISASELRDCSISFSQRDERFPNYKLQELSLKPLNGIQKTITMDFSSDTSENANHLYFHKIIAKDFGFRFSELNF